MRNIRDVSCSTTHQCDLFIMLISIKQWFINGPHIFSNNNLHILNSDAVHFGDVNFNNDAYTYKYTIQAESLVSDKTRFINF